MLRAAPERSAAEPRAYSEPVEGNLRLAIDGERGGDHRLKRQPFRLAALEGRFLAKLAWLRQRLDRSPRS